MWWGFGSRGLLLYAEPNTAPYQNTASSRCPKRCSMISDSEYALLRADWRKRKWMLRERSDKCERNSPAAIQGQCRRRAGGIEHRASQKKTMVKQAVSLQHTGSMWNRSSCVAHGGAQSVVHVAWRSLQPMVKPSIGDHPNWYFFSSTMLSGLRHIPGESNWEYKFFEYSL